MPSLAATKTANAEAIFPYRPVALFVGGTSGIGQAIAEALARYTKGNVHIILCGRNKSAAEKIIDSFPTSETSKYEFLECDASKLKNVVMACEVLRKERGISKINYMVLSQGYFARKAQFYDNGEGLDEVASLSFYSRYKFVLELLPLLQAAKSSGEEARILTVMGAGLGRPVDMSNIGFKKEWSGLGTTDEAPTYNSAAVEAFARRNPGLSFTHCHPGLVNTPLKYPEGILWAIGNWIATSFVKLRPSDCGEWQVSNLLSPAKGSGAFHVNQNADPVPSNKLHLSEEVNDAIYAHLLETLDAKK